MRRALEETLNNAKIVKDQMGSLDCSRKASMDFASSLSQPKIENGQFHTYDGGKKVSLQK
jgi:hypothetical protein